MEHEAVPSIPPDAVDLPSGEALNERQAGEVARETFANLIIVAGPFDSGKTTILTSLFEAFQEAPFANFLFRGSRTLVGFERRCHLGREESGLSDPETSHTSIREGVRFLHLELASMEEGVPVSTSLLLSDVSGERFKQLQDTAAAVTEFKALNRADRLCLVIDGAKLVKRDTRHVARNDSRGILRSIIESGMLSLSCEIDVAFTKWDLIASAHEQDDVDVSAYVADIKNSLIGIAGAYAIRFHEVAARPNQAAKTPFAHGLPTLLRSWMGRSRRAPNENILYSPDNRAREFCRYTEAVLLNQKLEDGYVIQRF